MAPLAIFRGFGIELEYMIVREDTLSVLPATDRVLCAIAGNFASEVAVEDLAWSNELALHVIELKTGGPVGGLAALPARFQEHVRRINELLRPLGGRLMPSGMHPWMDPDAEMRLWPHEYNEVYEAFDRIFGCRGHGWANLQSVHLNLAFDGDEEFARLHAALRLLLPILPALAASSPIADGRPSGFIDNRLEVYRKNAARIPSITGRVIPEPVFTRAGYAAEILERMYRDIAPHDPEGVLQEEWLNARGAIPRFDRSAIEVRLLDVQECPLADLAIAQAITAVLEALAGGRWSEPARQRAWPVEPLEAILLAAIRDGERAVIADAEYLAAFGLRAGGGATAGELWRHLIETLIPPDAEPGRWCRAPLDAILRHGPLARRILRAAGEDPARERLAAVYRALCDCLAAGRMFMP